MPNMKRRKFLQSAAMASAVSLGSHARAEQSLAGGTAEHCVFIWLGGGMSQIDTFDPKSLGDPANRKPGSAYNAIDTCVDGVQVCEHLANMAERMDCVTAVRSVHHDVIDEHAAAVNRVHTGRPVSGTVSYPSIGSIVANQRGPANDRVPAYVLIGYPNVTRGPGFLGAKDGFLYLTDTAAGPAGLTRPGFVNAARQERRAGLLDTLRETVTQNADNGLLSYDDALAESRRLSSPEFMKTFDLNSEPGDLRGRYGDEFGQRLLLTRRLIQRGVRFVEVSHNLNFVNGTGWDTHNDGQKQQHVLIRQLDRAVATLMDDLATHRLLDKTLIVIGTEFGRPGGFDAGGGRGHHGEAFSMVLAGGGLRHRGAVGITNDLAEKIVDQPVSVADFHATIHQAMGIDPEEYLYDGDRPVPITDGGQPIRDLFS